MKYQLSIYTYLVIVCIWSGCAAPMSSISENQLVSIQPNDLKGPKIELITPQTMRGLEVVHRGQAILVKGVAEDRSGVDRVEINDVLAVLNPDGTFSATLTLEDEQNELTVLAFDHRQNMSEVRFTVKRESGPQTQVPEFVRGRYYALLIGINTYEGVWPPLEAAAHDAKTLANVLEHYYHFDHVETLIDDEATRTAIISKIEWYERNLGPEDNLFIYYAGHGELFENRDRGYWVPADATTRSTVNYISNADVQSYIRGIPAKHTLLIADACFSGDLFRGKEEESEVVDQPVEEQYALKSRQVLTSGNLEPVPDKGVNGHSWFAYSLIETLRNSEAPTMDAHTLFGRIKSTVARNSDQSPQFDFLKNTGDEGGQFVFIRKK